MNFKWFKKDKDKNAFSLQNLLTNNVLVLEPIFSDSNVLSQDIPKDALLFFKWLVKNFKPASNEYLDDKEKNIILNDTTHIKKLQENKLFMIYIKKKMHGGTLQQFVLSNEDFNKKDYENALTNLINAYLQDKRPVKPIVWTSQSFAVITRFFNDVTFINEHWEFFEGTKATNVIHGNRGIFINYNGNRYILDASNDNAGLFSFNDVFTNKQILTNKDFNYECLVVLNSRKYAQDFKNTKQEPINFYSNEDLFVEDDNQQLDDASSNKYLSANSINLKEIDIVKDPLFIKNIKILARTVFNNILLNLNKSVDGKILAFFKEQKPTCKIKVFINKDDYGWNLRFNFVLQTDLTNSLLTNKNIMNLYDTFCVDLIWEPGNNLCYLIYNTANKLSHFTSISPMIELDMIKFKMTDKASYLNIIDKKITNFRNNPSFNLQEEVCNFFKNRNKWHIDSFYFLLRKMYDDFAKQLIEHYNKIQDLRYSILKNNQNWKIINNNEIEDMRLKYSNYYYYKGIDYKEKGFNEEYMWGEEENVLNSKYNFQCFSSVDHTIYKHAHNNEQILNENDVLFRLKIKDSKIQIPVRFSDLFGYGSSLDYKIKEIENTLKEQNENTNIQLTISKLDETIEKAKEDEKIGQEQSGNKFKR